MTRIRLGIVTVSARLGGTELSLLRLLKAYPRSEFEPHLCVLAEEGPLAEDFRRAGVEFTALGARSLLDLPRLLAVRDWIRKTDPDILHGYIYGAALAVRAFGHLGRVRPVVVAIHGIDQWRSPLHDLVERPLWSRADAYVSGSEAARQEMLRRFGDAVPIHLIRNGIDPPECPPRDRARAALGIPEDVPVVLCVANFHPYKRHAELIFAFQQVALGVPGARLLLVGTGRTEERCRRLAESLGVAPAVEFLGARRDIGVLNAACDVAVLASTEESTPNTLYEAAFAARPVVATAVGGVAEIVLDRITGLLVPPRQARPMADALISLLLDPRRRERMGAAALEHARRNFGLDREVSEMVAFYRDLVGRMSPGLREAVRGSMALPAPAGRRA